MTEMFNQSVDEIGFEVVVRAVSSDTDSADLTPLNIAILRNITVQHTVTYLKYMCRQEGFFPHIHAGGYDDAMPETLNSEGALYRSSPEVIIVCLKMEVLSESLTSGFSAMSESDVQAETERILSFINAMINNIRQRTTAMILLHNFEVPIAPALGIYDYQTQSGQLNTFRKINADLLGIAADYPSVYVVDADLLQSTIGYRNYYDNRFWYLSMTPYTPDAAKVIAKEYMKFILAQRGKNKKCLVLDCDNTLWGGIIGEDGINKIKIGGSYPGSAYRDFQRAALNLYNRGVLLALCSKNNESDVLEALEKHPDMLLRRHHFAACEINWNIKDVNLRKICEALNVGLQSMVFIDDSDFEIELIKKMLPEVTALRLPKDVSRLSDFLNGCGLFDSLSISDEDRKRNALYRSEAQRKTVKADFTSLSDYYRYLEMDVDIAEVNALTVVRAGQLTQRTNQFNLTTKRYTEADLSAMSGSPDWLLLCLTLTDRFGDSGMVGLSIINYTGMEAVVDTFLLSCRVIGRGVEDVLLGAAIGEAKKRHCKCLIGIYVPTKKNAQVAHFYIDHGFVPVHGETGRYELSLDDAVVSMPDYFKTISLARNE